MTVPAADRRTRRGPLSTDLPDPEAIPYFLWDEPMTVREVNERLATASPPERLRLLGKILREARDEEVWKFTTPEEVARLWPRPLPPPRPVAGVLELPPGDVEEAGTPWSTDSTQ